MYCVVIGIHPPRGELAKVVRDVKTVENESVDWHETSTATDDGKLTFLASAWTLASSDALYEAVQYRVKELHVECEIWATSPAPLPLRPTKGYDLHFESVDMEMAYQRMKEWGILIQSSIISQEGVDYIRSVVDEAISNVEMSLRENRPQLKIGQDEMLFQEIASRNLERFDLRLQDNSDAICFVQDFVLANASVAAFLERTLGSATEIDFDVSVVYSKPGACPQSWHADGAHQRGAKDAGWTTDGWRTDLADPYALCLFIPLIPLNDSVGYTQFWPGSHRHRDLAGFGKVAELVEATVDGICQAGDGVWYDYRLLHRGMPNKSSITRHIIQIVFKKKWYVEQVNYGSEPIAKGHAIQCNK